MKCASAKCTEDLVEEETFCTLCRNYYHFKCANITEIGYNRKNADLKAAWRCPTCRATGGGGTPEPTLYDVMLELKRFRANIEPQVTEVSDSLKDLKRQWKEMDSRVKIIEDRISTAEDNFSALSTLPKELKEAKECISNLVEANNAQEQFSRLNNVEIGGIPLKKNENLVEILQSISSKIGFPLCSTDVDTIHRVRRFVNSSNKPGIPQATRPPAIIVRFTQRRRKDAFLAAKRAHKTLNTADIGIAGPANEVFITHHLTPANKLLLKEAKSVKLTLQYSYLWVQDCKILMRKNDEPHSKIIHIKSEGDLRKLK
ncbi:hypothetical protein NE865_00642 [Phthorimaea operculella]|nr:hypothetical protein NE865_01039 [Phthorimaea operculella]KAI5651398.1 hypothetical protein NE865_00642 [Phthorimaea operculella]